MFSTKKLSLSSCNESFVSNQNPFTIIAFDVILFKLNNDNNSSNTVKKFDSIIGIVGFLNIMSPSFVLNLNSSVVSFLVISFKRLLLCIDLNLAFYLK